MADATTQLPAAQTNPDPATAALGASGVVDASAKDTLLATPNAEKPAEEKKADTPAFGKDEKTGADKPAEDKKPEEKKAEEAKTAPEKYDFKLPDGVKIDEATMTEFSTLAKGMNLPQAEAQKVLDMGAKYAAKWNADATAAIKTTQTQWATELRRDPTLGGEKLAENLGIAQKGLNAYDTDGKLNKLLTDTGLSNNVEVVRLFHKIGATLKEDKVVSPDQSGSTVSNLSGPGSLTAAAAQLYGTKP